MLLKHPLAYIMVVISLLASLYGVYQDFFVYKKNNIEENNKQKIQEKKQQKVVQDTLLEGVLLPLPLLDTTSKTLKKEMP